MDRVYTHRGETTGENYAVTEVSDAFTTHQALPLIRLHQQEYAGKGERIETIDELGFVISKTPDFNAAHRPKNLGARVINSLLHP